MRKLILATLALCVSGSTAWAYPIDGYPDTGIRRLNFYELAQKGEVDGRKQPAGGLLGLADVKPRLIGSTQAFDFPVDADYAGQITSFLGSDAPNYGITLLDLTDPSAPIYAEHNAGIRNNVGSVGKLLVGLAFFQTLAEIYPNDIEARRQVLITTSIVADEFVKTDHHKVVFWDVESRVFEHRPIHVGDEGSLYDWLDWMLSASSNAAASTIEEQLILLKHFGKEYPVSLERKAEFFSTHNAAALGAIFLATMKSAVVDNGLDPDLIRQGSFFTRTGKARVTGTTSYGNPRELAHLLLRMEQGRLVDEYSSTELKRMLYMTQRRIRYASHPALNDYAVYFKSGSLYSCIPEEGFRCGKYMGNKTNLLASIAIIEGPENSQRYHYLVVVSSNVLRKNSAVAHQTLAMRIHRMIEKRHAQDAPSATE
ncbi:MAG: hypothetical protein E2O54_04910 [Gammaproteobacteria bacterium]|nr:MAG: hypothetical protein E2O54_04910 [Gammaproteobacteria bacterium]